MLSDGDAEQQLYDEIEGAVANNQILDLLDFVGCTFRFMRLRLDDIDKQEHCMI